MPIKNLLKPPFFKSSSDDAARASGAAATPAESIDLIRKRAKHRLIGAAVLVLVAVVGFPLLFDTQPRPISVDIPIDIPDKATTKPLALPAQAAAVASPVTSPSPAAPAVAAVVAATGSLGPKEEFVSTKKEEKAVEAGANTSSIAIKKEAKPEPKASPAVPAKPIAPAPAAKPAAAAPIAAPVVTPAAAPTDDGKKARALLEGKDAPPVATPAPAAAESGRFVVQVGAFADAALARETRLRVEKAGLKTYTQVAETKDGKRIRVRVGPFATKAEADKAAGKIKALDLPAAILTL